MTSEIEPESAAIDSLREIGREFHGRGWSLGTSSNYSTLLSREPFRLLITASGKDKSRLGRDDFVIVDRLGKLVDASQTGRPSAETLLHVVAAGRPGVGAVLHTHSPWATVLSDAFADRGPVTLEGYEMLKGLEGVKTHEHRETLRIFDNTQDIAALATEVQRLMDGGDPSVRYGFLMRRHGLYTWGRDLAEARRHIEVLEFLFEVIGRTMTIQAGLPTPA